MTPNPSKAPWYFLGLQELLSRFPPLMAGVAFPTFVIVLMILVPFLDRNPSRRRQSAKSPSSSSRSTPRSWSRSSSSHLLPWP